MSIQGSINQLLGSSAVLANLTTGISQKNFEAKQAQAYNAAYNAKVEAAKTKYTKSGNKSRSKAAKEAQAAAEEAAVGLNNPTAPWTKYDAKIAKLNEQAESGAKKLKQQAKEAKEATYKQFGDYAPIGPDIMKKLSAEDRWQLQAGEKLKQQEAFNAFKNSLGGKQ